MKVSAENVYLLYNTKQCELTNSQRKPITIVSHLMMVVTYDDGSAPKCPTGDGVVWLRAGDCIGYTDVGACA